MLVQGEQRICTVLGAQAPYVLFALCCQDIDLVCEWRLPCLYPSKNREKEDTFPSFKRLTWK